MERQDSLWPGGPIFYYDDRRFPPGTDAFLLGDFARPKRNELVCDLGAGTGLIGLLLFAREPSIHLHSVEIQPESLRLAEKTLSPYPAENHLADLRDLKGILPLGKFHLVVSNPPYFKAGSGLVSQKETLVTARSENDCTLADVCTAAGQLLRWGGRFAVVHRPDRLCDLLLAMREAGIEPKRLRLVQHDLTRAPSLVLLEGRRGGNPGLTVEPPLLLHHPDGSDTDELRRIYFRDRKEP